jgi:hypothetical protein
MIKVEPAATWISVILSRPTASAPALT